jgi:hypothetical protein
MTPQAFLQAIEDKFVTEGLPHTLKADTAAATECLNFYRIARNRCRSGFALRLENPRASARN